MGVLVSAKTVKTRCPKCGKPAKVDKRTQLIAAHRDYPSPRRPWEWVYCKGEGKAPIAEGIQKVLL